MRVSDKAEGESSSTKSRPQEVPVSTCLPAAASSHRVWATDCPQSREPVLEPVLDPLARRSLVEFCIDVRISCSRRRARSCIA